MQQGENCFMSLFYRCILNQFGCSHWYLFPILKEKNKRMRVICDYSANGNTMYHIKSEEQKTRYYLKE